MIETKCSNCEKTIWKYPYEIKSYKHLFCNGNCKREWQIKHWSGKNSPFYKGGLIERICKQCGKKFQVYPCFKDCKYCSQKCYWKTMEGVRPWNYGLTKETDTRVKKGIEKMSKTLTGRTLSKSQCNNMRKSMILSHKKKVFGFPKGNRKSFRDKESYLKGSLKMGKAMLIKWKDPEFVKKQMKARNITPNKTELRFEKFLNKILPSEYEFVGDGQLIIGGRCPDYVNINGRKKLIELYGDYWHRNDDPQDKINHYKQYGFETLIVWEHELKDLLKVKNQITQFNNI